jgi:hypothetical protein
MNNLRNLLLGISGVLGVVSAGRVAHADRKMVVLIDASGSMITPRPADAANPTRFDAAKSRAADQVRAQAKLGLDGVAVYTFSDDAATVQTLGFVGVNDALTAIGVLDLAVVGNGTTPLAGSVCDVVDVLVGTGATVKVLGLSSDGEENSTPLTHQCAGPFSTIPDAPYSDGSWENKVLNYVVDHGVTPYIDLFNPDPIISFAAQMQARAVDPEAAITAKARSISPLAAAAATAAVAVDQPPTLEAFFTELALEAGGRLTVVDDGAAKLPVTGDASGDGCVDRSDALRVARAFGLSGPPQNQPLDLDGDGKVGYSDYAFAVSSFTPGGCGTPDPYVSRAPIVCTGLTTVTVTGQAIEGGGITVDARGACQLVIKNSLIVSGQSAIKVVGAAVITVDNSIIVGENAVLASQGATVLSAAKTVFHGKKTVTGALLYIDRGGNTWE